MVMNLYNEQVKLVERTSASGTTFTLAKLFDKTTGPWDNLKKGDAAHKPIYGVAGFLNLVVLLYAAMLVGLLDWLFLASVPEDRIPYVEWTFVAQLSYLALTASCVATLLTAMFKHYRVADFAALTAILWVVGALAGADIGGLMPSVPHAVVVVGGLALQLASIAYLVLGARPNVTYLTRVKRAA